MTAPMPPPAAQTRAAVPMPVWFFARDMPRPGRKWAAATARCEVSPTRRMKQGARRGATSRVSYGEESPNGKVIAVRSPSPSPLLPLSKGRQGERRVALTTTELGWSDRIHGGCNEKGGKRTGGEAARHPLACAPSDNLGSIPRRSTRCHVGQPQVLARPFPTLPWQPSLMLVLPLQFPLEGAPGRSAHTPHPFLPIGGTQGGWTAAPGRAVPLPPLALCAGERGPARERSRHRWVTAVGICRAPPPFLDSGALVIWGGGGHRKTPLVVGGGGLGGLAPNPGRFCRRRAISGRRHPSLPI